MVVKDSVGIDISVRIGERVAFLVSAISFKPDNQISGNIFAIPAIFPIRVTKGASTRSYIPWYQGGLAHFAQKSGGFCESAVNTRIRQIFLSSRFYELILRSVGLSSHFCSTFYDSNVTDMLHKIRRTLKSLHKIRRTNKIRRILVLTAERTLSKSAGPTWYHSIYHGIYAHN
jgi:hypothetical protein